MLRYVTLKLGEAPRSFTLTGPLLRCSNWIPDTDLKLVWGASMVCLFFEPSMHPYGLILYLM